MQMFRRVAAGWVAILFALAALPAGADDNDFYAATAAELSGPPGSLIRIGSLPRVHLTTAMAYRILYRSTDIQGEPEAVSAVVVVPIGPPPASGWPVVAYGHGTTGIAQPCAPSLLPNPLTQISGINRLISDRYVVVASDYPGLGTDGPHPKLVGPSAARSILNSVRAVRNMRQAHAGDRFALWGYSQGGHAVLWASQLAASYAPDLKLVGVATAAPATEIVTLFEDDEYQFAGRVLSAMVFKSWSSPEIYGAPVDKLIDADAIPIYEAVAERCIDQVIGGLGDLLAKKRIGSEPFIASPTDVEPWRSLMLQNIPTTNRIDAPYFIAQGTADTIVDPPVTEDYVDRLCRNGAVVEFRKYPGVNHFKIPRAAGTDAANWIADRFAGEPAPDTC